MFGASVRCPTTGRPTLHRRSVIPRFAFGNESDVILTRANFRALQKKNDLCPTCGPVQECAPTVQMRRPYSSR